MQTLTKRERIIKMLNFEPLDVPALEVDISKRGLYEHGEKLYHLLKTIEGDFNVISRFDTPVPDPSMVDSDGRFLSYTTDGWGVTWESRIFLMTGHACKRPLDDLNNLKNFKPPKNAYPDKDTPEFIELKKRISLDKERFYKKMGWISILEKMIALRKFETVLEDIYSGTPEINYIADMIVDYQMKELENILALDPDAVRFADDFGMQETMLISPYMFRSFFKPRYEKLISYVKSKGKKAFMHCCGHVLPIFEDYKEIGIDEIWTQISVYDQPLLAEYAREKKIVLAIHPDRAGLMTNGTPLEIKKKIKEYSDIYRPQDGGSYFYLEIDNGFPYENIEALVSAIQELRN